MLLDELQNRPSPNANEAPDDSDHEVVLMTWNDDDSDATDDEVTDVRTSSSEGVPADEYGFPQVSMLEYRLASVDVAEVLSPPRVTIQAKRLD